MSMTGEIEVVGFESVSSIVLALLLNGYEVVVQSDSEYQDKEQRAYSIKFCHKEYEGRQFVIYDEIENEIIFSENIKQKLCDCEEKKNEQNADGSNT